MIRKRTNKKDIAAMEITISNFLRIGVAVSAIVILIGLIMLLFLGSGYPGNTFPISVPGIVQGLLLLKPDAVILSGLLLLVLTPVFRVGVSILVFAQEKDRLYVAITSIVFVILIISFWLGKML